MPGTEIATSIVPDVREHLDDWGGPTEDASNYAYTSTQLRKKVALAVRKANQLWPRDWKITDGAGANATIAAATHIEPALDLSKNSDRNFVLMLGDICIVLCKRLYPAYSFNNRDINSSDSGWTAPPWRKKTDDQLIKDIVDHYKAEENRGTSNSWISASGLVKDSYGIVDNLDKDLVKEIKDTDLSNQNVSL